MAVNYMSKWVEARATQKNDSKLYVLLLKAMYFLILGHLGQLLMMGVVTFLKHAFRALLKKYNITHKIATLTIHK